MAHNHSVRDSGARFTIDQYTRQIRNASANKTTIVQYDHNSEQITFEMPLYIDGHAMTLCNLIEIHYINISTDGQNQNPGVYEVTDLKAEGEKAVFTWTVKQEATQLAGSLNFFVVFKCTENGKTVYRWGTEICKTLSVSDGMDNGEAVLTEYPDILAQWKAQIFGASDDAVLTVANAKADALSAIEAAGEAKKQAVLDSIPDEYEALSALADSNYRGKAGAIVLDAEGESIILNDASEYPLQGLKLFGKSTQDGTPTPDAPVDIVSKAISAVDVYGKNLVAYPFSDGTITRNGITYTDNGDGSVFVSGTCGSSGSWYSANYKRELPKGTYTLSAVFDGISADSEIYAYMTDRDASKTLAIARVTTPNVTFTIAEDLKNASVSIAIPKEETLWGKIWLQLEQGLEATDYVHPKITQTVETSHTLPGIPVSSGGNYTDANGQQWICDEVDLARGVYVQRVAHIVVDETSDVRMNVSTDGKTNGYPYRYFLNLNNIMVNPESIMCDRLAYKNVNALVGNSPENEGITVSPVYSCIYLNLNQHMTEDTVDECKAALANYPLTVNHVLATPIETPLSDVEINAFRALHSNKPNTTILNDAGAFMAVSYVADTKTYIDNKIKEMMEGVTE